VISNKSIIIQMAIVLVALVFVIKLFFIQVTNTDYRLAAQNNAILRQIEHPLRGMIYDRNGKLIVANTPVFDIMIIPKRFRLKPEDTAKFCKDFNITHKELIDYYDKARISSRVKPSTFVKLVKPTLLIKHILPEQFADLQDKLNNYPGIYAEARSVRNYPHSNMANALGYVKEVDKKVLEKDSAHYYQQGDLIGKTGMELTYEQELRGQRGIHYLMVNVHDVVKGSFQNGKLDTLPRVGDELVSSIDLDLQQYGEYLMQNKIGSVVAIEPATGEILSLISAPSYDPNLLTGNGKEVSANYEKLVNNEYKPLFNRPTMALYPPGSIIKLVQCLIGLQEKVIDSVHTSIPCVQDVVKCHNHKSPLDVKGSIQNSCNPFYYRVFNRIIRQNEFEDNSKDTRIGLAKWHKHMVSFGLGNKLNTDLDNEKGGNIPSVEYYDRRFRNEKWRFGNIYSLSIGQGEMGVIPLQMANVAAIMANRGYYYTPHIIKKMEDGKLIDEKFRIKHKTTVEEAYFNTVVDAMEKVVSAGTARRAFIKDIAVCGKTGTAQNPHGEDHSVFIAFAPRNNPKIAIAVYVENAGFGGTWAAPIASLMIEKYIRGHIEDEKRKAMEKEIAAKNFIINMDKKKAKDAILKREKAKKTEKDEVDENVKDKQASLNSLPESETMTQIKLKNKTVVAKYRLDTKKH
jgi:penicillin-binding protein 2